MTVPETVRCADGHFRRAVYSLAAYIADYPEQAFLTSVVQGWCPRSAFFMPVAMTRLISSIDVLQSRTTLMARVFNAPVSLLHCLRAGLNQGFCGMSTVLSGVLWYVLVLFNLPLLITSTTSHL
jgi:hypothetical protein